MNSLSVSQASNKQTNKQKVDSLAVTSRRLQEVTGPCYIGNLSWSHGWLESVLWVLPKVAGLSEHLAAVCKSQEVSLTTNQKSLPYAIKKWRRPPSWSHVTVVWTDSGQETLKRTESAVSASNAKSTKASTQRGVRGHWPENSGQSEKDHSGHSNPTPSL